MKLKTAKLVMTKQKRSYPWDKAQKSPLKLQTNENVFLVQYSREQRNLATKSEKVLILGR